MLRINLSKRFCNLTTKLLRCDDIWTSGREAGVTSSTAIFPACIYRLVMMSSDLSKKFTLHVQTSLFAQK